MLDSVTKEQTDQAVTIGDVYKEIDSILNHTFKCKKTTKLSAFAVPNVNIPHECEYLEVSI